MADNTPFTAQITFPVRYAETDAMGIVHHASYLVYFEEGRRAYTDARGRSYADMETDGYFLAVKDVQVKYRQAMRYGQRARVVCWVAQVRSRTLRFIYEIYDADTDILCVTGETGHICLTHDGRPARFPESWNI